MTNAAGVSPIGKLPISMPMGNAKKIGIVIIVVIVGYFVAGLGGIGLYSDPEEYDPQESPLETVEQIELRQKISSLSWELSEIVDNLIEEYQENVRLQGENYEMSKDDLKKLRYTPISMVGKSIEEHEQQKAIVLGKLDEATAKLIEFRKENSLLYEMFPEKTEILTEKDKKMTEQQYRNLMLKYELYAQESSQTTFSKQLPASCKGVNSMELGLYPTGGKCFAALNERVELWCLSGSNGHQGLADDCVRQFYTKLANLCADPVLSSVEVCLMHTFKELYPKLIP